MQEVGGGIGHVGEEVDAAALGGVEDELPLGILDGDGGGRGGGDEGVEIRGGIGGIARAFVHADVRGGAQVAARIEGVEGRGDRVAGRRQAGSPRIDGGGPAQNFEGIWIAEGGGIEKRILEDLGRVRFPGHLVSGGHPEEQVVGDQSNVAGIDIRKDDKDLSFRMPSIDDSFLDYIELKCPLWGTNGVPSQEKVNDLWEAFEQSR